MMAIDLASNYFCFGSTFHL